MRYAMCNLKAAALAAVIISCTAWAGPAVAETLKIATDSGAKGSDAGNAIENWAKEIETATNGELKLEIFYQNELGGQQEVFDLLMAGDVDLMLNWPMTSYDKRISLIYTPYMFTDWSAALAAYGKDGWLSSALSEVYADAGLKYLGAWPEGFNGVGTKGGHATTVEAAKTFKVRVPPVSPFTETIAAMGYQTATIDWGELYSALQTGVVDGDSANVIFYDFKYFGDVLTDYVHSRQQFLTGILTANMESWDKLSPEQQQAVAAGAEKVMLAQFEAAKRADDGYVEDWKKLGHKYVELSPEELESLRKTVREAVWPQMEPLIGADLLDLVRQNASAD
ncbi:TRAP-type C4-dicarboxylate transport system substrate-binding protein [Mycoplana sp. BE70]|uniref:TRAP transporter substrate-binding protein DctP n=1 Tax=Mycoplana sp. BE70 TaxID=2817775 RepID=UPI00285BFB64|nr:TRAP transporter substrate-binding protein DctP [Mycoplana sp. BE70]MDR6758027.1 TRAP-type C4-dicarboxylate transport system substrate-binding protein [Mycoplana sp. BE70]